MADSNFTLKQLFGKATFWCYLSFPSFESLDNHWEFHQRRLHSASDWWHWCWAIWSFPLTKRTTVGIHPGRGVIKDPTSDQKSSADWQRQDNWSEKIFWHLPIGSLEFLTAGVKVKTLSIFSNLCPKNFGVTARKSVYPKPGSEGPPWVSWRNEMSPTFLTIC